MTQAEAEARELEPAISRAEELAALPRGIGDIHARDRRPRLRRARPARGARALRPRHDLARRLRERARRAVRVRDERRHPRAAPATCRCLRRRAARWRSPRSTGSTATGWRPRAARSRSRCRCAASGRPSPARRRLRPRPRRDRARLGPPVLRRAAARRSSASRPSSSATTPAATSPRTARRSRRCSTSCCEAVEVAITIVGHSMGGLVARSRLPPRRRVDGEGPPHRLARHAAHGRAARAGRARDERRAAPRPRDPPVRPLPAPPQRGHPRPAPRLAGRRGLAAARTPTRCARRRCARSRCSRTRRTASSPPRSRAATSTRSAACSATRSSSRRAPPAAASASETRPRPRRHPPPRAAQPPRGLRAAATLARTHCGRSSTSRAVKRTTV